MGMEDFHCFWFLSHEKALLEVRQKIQPSPHNIIHLGDIVNELIRQNLPSKIIILPIVWMAVSIRGS